MSLPVGPLVSTEPASVPPFEAIHGQYTSLIPFETRHADALFKHLGGIENGHRWTYMFGGPYVDQEEWNRDVAQWSSSRDPLCFTVLSGPASDPKSEPVGMMSYMNIVPTHRRIEIGSVILSEQLRQTLQATEAFYLLIKHAIDSLGYLRVEWKANHLNKPSAAAATRLGFVFEGFFRSHMIIKGRRRDTAWFSIIDEDWPVVKRGFEAWLDQGNFDQDGQQVQSLRALRESLKDPNE